MSVMHTCENDGKLQHAAAQLGCSSQADIHRQWQQSGLGSPLQQHALYVLGGDCRPHHTCQHMRTITQTQIVQYPSVLQERTSLGAPYPLYVMLSVHGLHEFTTRLSQVSVPE